jgi:ubiquitin-like-conjugating enzyme ATG10
MANRQLVRYEEFQNYPFLTAEEFELACHYLDSKYTHASLGKKRRIFKLRVQRSLTDSNPYITITTPIDVADGGIDELLSLGFLSTADDGDADMDGIQNMDVVGEDEDSVSLSRAVGC